MKPITLRGVSPDLERVLREAARRTGRSLNRIAIELLERGAGLDRGARVRHHELDHLAGSWSTAEADSFDRDLAEQRRVDLELWR